MDVNLFAEETLIEDTRQSNLDLAEEVGYVDLTHFPELPEQKILQGLQDQATAIVAELCDNCREVPDEVKKLCILLLQMTEMSLYLELCVVHRYEILYIENVSFVLHNNQPTNPRETESDTCGTFGAAAPGAYAESEILTSA
ncbi:hypothetical protein DY000_02009081 [Brassica cretica]|uniref:Uncharacterized protein n=1 Tax=Brassica cretica TaxID=69181 RepID=A0ABQ7CMB8_BRACR|nr:hypothetical protein DY000_02009081 [Brassica cretica]